MSHLERRLKVLESERPSKEPNVLDTDEWRLIRSILLRESEPYPETHADLLQTIRELERAGSASTQVVQETLQAVLPWSDVRWAIAEALWKVGHPD